MDRIKSLVGKINIIWDTLKIIETRYQNKTKGDIYRKSVKYNIDKKATYIKELDEFGSGSVTTWAIRGVDLNTNPPTNIELLRLRLESSITEEEIISRLLLSKIEVSIISQIGKIDLGFPRISRK